MATGKLTASFLAKVHCYLRYTKLYNGIKESTLKGPMSRRVVVPVFINTIKPQTTHHHYVMSESVTTEETNYRDSDLRNSNANSEPRISVALAFTQVRSASYRFIKETLKRQTVPHRCWHLLCPACSSSWLSRLRRMRPGHQWVGTYRTRLPLGKTLERPSAQPSRN